MTVQTIGQRAGPWRALLHVRRNTTVDSKTLTYFATGGRSADCPWLRFMGRVLNGVAVGPRGEILYVNLT